MQPAADYIACLNAPHESSMNMKMLTNLWLFKTFNVVVLCLQYWLAQHWILHESSPRIQQTYSSNSQTKWIRLFVVVDVCVCVCVCGERERERERERETETETDRQTDRDRNREMPMKVWHTQLTNYTEYCTFCVHDIQKLNTRK